MRGRESLQPATTIALHFHQKVVPPVLWRTRGNVVAVAGLKEKRPKHETSDTLFYYYYKDWDGMRERERETVTQTAWKFCFALPFPWWVGPTSNIPDNFASSLRLRLYMSAPPISLHSTRVLQNRSISPPLMFKRGLKMSVSWSF